MSEIQAANDPYETHPLGSLFIEEAFRAHETSGEPTIAPGRLLELSAVFGLDRYHASAHVFLARNRVVEMLEEIEWIQPIDADQGGN